MARETFLFHDRIYRFSAKGLLFDKNIPIGKFKSINEAKNHLRALRISEDLIDTRNKQTEKISHQKLFVMLKESGDRNITPQKIHAILNIIEEKKFSPLPVVLECRRKQDIFFLPGKIDYILEDNTTVILEIETNKTINKKIQNDEILTRKMCSNKKNFLEVAKKLLLQC